MPKKEKLVTLLTNCKKSGSRLWSEQLIRQYRNEAFDLVQQNLDLGNSTEYRQLFELLREKEAALNFSKLPDEYPSEEDKKEIEFRVYTPAMVNENVTPSTSSQSVLYGMNIPTAWSI